MEIKTLDSMYPEGSRFDEIEKILSFIKEGNSSQVVSIPGAGRSNLFGLLAYNRRLRIKHLGEKQKYYHFVYVDFSEIKKRPIEDSFKFILIAILDSLRERGLKEEFENINEIFKKIVPINDSLVLSQGLKEVVEHLCIEKKLNLILLFDRFEAYIPSLTSEFFTTLRSLRNKAKYSFSVVFGVNRPLEDSLEADLFADFYEFAAGKLVWLPLFDKEGLGFRISHLEKIAGKKIEKEEIEKILKITGGQGKITLLSLEVLLSNDISGPESEISKFLLTQKPIRNALYGIWNSLSSSEQRYLIKKDYIDDENYLYLENLGLIKSKKLTIPLFDSYVEEKSKNYTNEDEKIRLVEGNEIFDGEDLISDKLTSSEYKLLRYFLENEEKIVEKQDLINSVWSENKTTLGVTDQAIDQLIFRLRKKIEDNPNSPIHIQTIKGRGFKFSS